VLGWLSEGGWSWPIGGGGTRAGEIVTYETALAQSAVYACIRVIAETIASLPLSVVLADGDKREPMPSHPAARLVNEPSPELTAFEAKELLLTHLLSRGNSVWEKVRDRGNRVRELNPLHPDCVRIERERRSDGLKGPLRYVVTTTAGGQKTLDPDEVVHVRGLSLDGVHGLSPIMLHRETIGKGIAAAAYGARFFSNDARPGGILKFPAGPPLSDKAFDRLKESWNDKATAHSTKIVEGGGEYQAIGMTNEEAQFLETMKYSAIEICRIFRVPPHKIADLERATFSNIEHQDIEFFKGCIVPWIVRIEHRLDRDLLSEDERESGYGFKFNVAGVLRGALKERYEAYRVGRDGGWLSSNDIRRLEDLPPIPGGDIYLVPLNMAIAKGDTPRPIVGQKEGPQPAKTPPAGSDDPDTDVPTEEEGKPTRADPAVLVPLLTEAIARTVRKETKHVRNLLDRPEAAREIGAFYQENHRRLLADVLAPAVRSLRSAGFASPPEDVIATDIANRAADAIAAALARSREAARQLLDEWETDRTAQLVDRLLATVPQPSTEAAAA
jgi:HK97 family phage portal protein